MSSPSRKRVRKTRPEQRLAEAPPYTQIKDAASLLRNATRRLDDVMRLLAEATLLQPDLDDQLGIEAQRLIGVRKAVQAEIKALEVQRLREMD
jgi:hypothetical protein